MLIVVECLIIVYSLKKPYVMYTRTYMYVHVQSMYMYMPSSESANLIVHCTYFYVHTYTYICTLHIYVHVHVTTAATVYVFFVKVISAPSSVFVFCAHGAGDKSHQRDAGQFGLESNT